MVGVFEKLDKFTIWMKGSSVAPFGFALAFVVVGGVAVVVVVVVVVVVEASNVVVVASVRDFK